MNFSQKFSIRKNNTAQEFMRGIHSPTLLDWRPVIEDYLYISEKRTFEKWSNFKLRQNIFTDIVLNIKAIDGYKELQNGIESEIASLKIINKVLREIVDGMVWSFFSRMRFEFWSPFSLVAELKDFFKLHFKKTTFDQYLTHYIDDEKIWR